MKTLKITILTLLSFFVIINCILLLSRYQYQKGINFMNEKEYENAVASFTRAENLIPKFSIKTFFPRDYMRIHTKKGMAFHEQGLSLWKEKGISATVFALYKKAGESLTKAVEIDPNIYIPAYWLARTQNALESISGFLFPGKPNPYNALPLYKKTIALKPSGISAYYSYIRYLFHKGEKKPIPKLAQYMTKIYPQSYFYLKKEPFFNDNLQKNMEAGLFSALNQNISPRYALQALSDIQVKKQDYKNAIAHYHKSLELRPFANTSGNYLHMGQLYLKTRTPGETEKSIPWFTKGLKTADNFDAALTRIFHIHTKEKALNEFIRFSIQLEKTLTHTPILDINIAKAWIQTKNLQLARARLLKLNAREPNARAHYLLAKIAEKKKDWDQVEISVQKATTLDRENPDYYHLFSRALYHQKKYAHAEETASKAIKYSKKENPWFFSHRAWTRWNQQNYIKAAADWKKASTIKPDRSDFPYWVARSYEQEGLFNEALTFVKKAIAQEPDTQKYKDLKKKLETHKR